jgi:ABC-type Fe3+/spermidine/putrescine transport system ATPase subunit
MVLEVKSLKKTYGDFSLSLDLSVGEGETLALVGASGSGKTTALNLIAGLAEPESGSVIIDGEDVTSLPAYKRNISVVFQELALFPHLDVGGNIAYGLFIRGVTRKERRKIIEETLEIVHLPFSYATRRIDTLSGGERQRVAIARSLASNPRALLLDEPFSSLDAPLRKSLRREFLEIRSHSNAPCIFITHDREEAVMLGDRVALMSGGRIIEIGTGRDMLLAPKTEDAARFFSAGHVLPCRIASNASATHTTADDAVAENTAATHTTADDTESKKREACVEVSTPLGNLTVPQGDLQFNPALTLLFIPEDAIHLEPSGGAGLKPFSARFTGSLFEGKGLVLKFLLDPWENSPQLPAFEVTADKRMKAPEPGSMMNLWVDQSLIRFVK